MSTLITGQQRELIGKVTMAMKSHNFVLAMGLVTNQGAMLEFENDEFGNTPLHLAVIAGHLESMKCFISNSSSLIDKQNKQGLTPLHLAAFSGNIQTTQLLIENDADKKLIDNKGRTASEIATAKGHFKISQALSEQGKTLKHLINRNKRNTAIHM